MYYSNSIALKATEFAGKTLQIREYKPSKWFTVTESYSVSAAS